MMIYIGILFIQFFEFADIFHGKHILFNYIICTMGKTLEFDTIFNIFPQSFYLFFYKLYAPNLPSKREIYMYKDLGYYLPCQHLYNPQLSPVKVYQPIY